MTRGPRPQDTGAASQYTGSEAGGEASRDGDQ